MIYWNLKMMLSAYDSAPEFRNALLEQSRILVDFLKGNGLSLGDALDDYTGTELDLVLGDHNLTHDGCRLFSEGHVDKWLDANDDIQRPITTKRLETGLKRIKES